MRPSAVPSVLMLVINPMTADSRVEREAASLARAGYRVTVAATSAGHLPRTEERNGYRILRLPYRRTVKDRIVARWMRARTESSEQRRLVAEAQRHAPRTAAYPLTAALAWWNRGRIALRLAASRIRWAASGFALKMMKSRILVTEYWESIAHRLPHLVRRPDVIHAHDLGTLAAAVRLARQWGRARPDLPRPRVVFDSHELYVEQNPRWTRVQKLLWKLHERRWIRHADLIITVSPGIARELRRRYRVRRPPLVVYNSPDHDGREVDSDVRTDSGIAADRTLLVYVGAVKPGRGVDRLVPALALRRDWHLAVVGAGDGGHVSDLRRLAAEEGIGERLHVLPKVPAQGLPTYLRTADVGMHAMERTCLNHELALPNKLFDYVLAGLPVAVSDLREMGGFVEQHGVGTVFDPTEPESIAAAVDRLVADRPRFAPTPAKLAELEATYGWESQADRLLAAYTDLLEERFPSDGEGAPEPTGDAVGYAASPPSTRIVT